MPERPQKQSDWILTTKLNPPLIRADIVDRPQLLARLERDLRRPLTLIAAPAGYGKSMKQPPAEELENQVTYQRAFEAVIWSVPAVSIYQFYRAAMENGAEPNTIMAFSKPATQESEFLAANNVTPYVLS